MAINIPKVIPHEAIEYITSKGLATSYNWAEIYAQEHASKFTVAKIMELDVLDSIHQSVIDAVADGQTFHTFKKGMLEKLGEDGWGSYAQKDEVTGEDLTRLSDKRLKKVYQVNKTQSYHTGSWHRFEANKATHPYLRYRLGSSLKHRPEHKSFENLVLPVDDPFWQTHMPMNGWGCRCWVQSLTRDKAEKASISDSPKIEYHDWENKSTGRKHKVPKGISPGFEYNVGRHREHKALEMVTDKLTQVVTQNPKQANVTMSALLGDATQKAMIAKVVRAMVTEVAENKRAYGNTLAIGTINDEVVDKLTKMGKAPHHSIIAVRDDDILHALRDSKQAQDNNLPVEFWQDLPDKLQNPSAVLLQKKKPGSTKTAFDTLIFVYDDDDDDDDNGGKVIIKMDIQTQVKTGKKTREKVILNRVTTGSKSTIEGVKALENTELLYGKL